MKMQLFELNYKAKPCDPINLIKILKKKVWSFPSIRACLHVIACQPNTPQTEEPPKAKDKRMPSTDSTNLADSYTSYK